MKEAWEKKFDDDFYECIGDSPCNIDEVKSFISSQIKQAEKRGYERGRKENLMAIDKKVTEHFNKALKDTSNWLFKEAEKDGARKLLESLIEKLRKRGKPGGYIETGDCQAMKILEKELERLSKGE